MGGINLYGYVANNPIIYWDPDGKELAGAVIGGAIGAGIGYLSTGTWQGALAGGAGGFVGGLTFNPSLGILAASTLSGALAGGTSNLVKQGLDNASGCQHGFDGKSLGVSMAGGAAGGLLFGGALQGVGSLAGVSAEGALNPIQEAAFSTATGVWGDVGAAWADHLW